jgi:hypothetical protein
LVLEPSRSAHIHRIARVLTTIEFDYQPVLGAGKVCNEIADRMLPAEFVPDQAPIA